MADVLRRAVEQHQRGQLNEAEALYRQVLAAQPGNFDALHLCGVLMHQRGEPAEALKLIARALKTNARSAAGHSNYGTVLAALERHDEALESYDRAIALKPDYRRRPQQSRQHAARIQAPAGRACEFRKGHRPCSPIMPKRSTTAATRLFELDRNEDALANYDAGAGAATKLPDALVNRGQCLVRLEPPR